ELQKDIKKRKRTEEELKHAKQKAEKSDKLKSEFLAQMSHEIRTPVSSLLSFSNLIKEETIDTLDPAIAESFDVIDNAGRRITRTIDLILNMSQIQTGSYEAKFQEFDLQQRVINNIYNEYRKIASDKGLDLKIKKAGTDTRLLADEYTVFQIINNLVDNAVKYTHSGNVEIRVKNISENKLNVEVEDTGIGISEEYLPNIFNEFSQEQQGYTRKYDGNGLGLALVKRYCEINNAEIKVESKKGVGTKFEVTFEVDE
ncbi:MAG: sensor histidine kinase, partial [Rhodothermaceae bacterium]